MKKCKRINALKTIVKKTFFKNIKNNNIKS